MTRKVLLLAALILGIGMFGPLARSAPACPMCKIANEQDSLLPTAYMYSILFMMGMMFSLGGGVAGTMYLLSRKENASLAALEQFGELGADGALPGGIQPATA